MKLSEMNLAVATTVALASAAACFPSRAADDTTIVIIRHGEKPVDGDNLSCQGQNRALLLPPVLLQILGGAPAYTYVPKLKLGDSSKHARMFQTVTPFAVNQNLTVNSRFDEANVKGLAKELRSRSGKVLVVWEHSQIPNLAKALGVSHPPGWPGNDFDSVWTIRYTQGQASITTGSQGLTPSPECGP